VAARGATREAAGRQARVPLTVTCDVDAEEEEEEEEEDSEESSSELRLPVPSLASVALALPEGEWGASALLNRLPVTCATMSAESATAVRGCASSAETRSPGASGAERLALETPEAASGLRPAAVTGGWFVLGTPNVEALTGLLALALALALGR